MAIRIWGCGLRDKNVNRRPNYLLSPITASSHYRGWNGAAVDHNYNWWDATGTYPAAPGDGDGDGYGHGTHTTGTT